MGNPNSTSVPLNYTTADPTVMENISTAQGNSSLAARTGNLPIPFHYVLSFILPYLTKSADYSHFDEFEMFLKSAFVYWYIKQIQREMQGFNMHYDMLLLVICLRSAVGKYIDVCGLSLVWSCYFITSYLIPGKVWISFAILYIASFILLATAPSYFLHLAFIVDVLFVYTMNCYIVVGDRTRINNLLHCIWLALMVAGYFRLIYTTPGPTMDDLNLVYMMFAPIIGCALELGRSYTRPIYVTAVLCYCVYTKIYLSGVNE